MTTTQFTIIEEEGPDAAFVFDGDKLAFSGTVADCREHVLTEILGVKLLAAPEGFVRSVRGSGGVLSSLSASQERIAEIETSIHW